MNQLLSNINSSGVRVQFFIKMKFANLFNIRKNLNYKIVLKKWSLIPNKSAMIKQFN